MKRFYSLFITCILLMGCQGQLFYQTDILDDTPITKAGDLSIPFSIDGSYIFLSEKDPTIWADRISIEDKFLACEVPEEILMGMSTEALVRTVLKYPLNVLFNSFDNPLDAVKLIFKNSALHRELAGRDDVATVLLRCFAQTSIDKSIKSSTLNKSYCELTYVNEMFFEYFLASHLIPELYNETNEPLLRYIAIRKIHERRAFPEFFSEVSIQPLIVILGEDPDEKFDDAVDSPKEPSRASNWTWYSVFNKSISVEQNRTELTYYEMSQLLMYYYSLFPNSVVSSNPSNKYNANGYAWLYKEGLYVPYSPNPTMNNSWVRDINYVVDNDSKHQIEKLFDGDIYESCDTSVAEVIYYPADHHSAIRLSNGKYRSKWADGPLMEHNPSDCPYSTTELMGFRKKTTPDSCVISGNTHPEVNYDESYYFQPVPERSISIQWSVENLSTHNTSSFVLSDANSSTCHITFLEVAEYKVYLEVYLIDEYLNSHLLMTNEKSITSDLP